MDSAELKELERRLRGIAEDPMRREVVLEVLEGLPIEEAYALMAGTVRRPDREAPALPDLRRALHEVLALGGATRPFDYELRAALYAAAFEHQDEFLMRLLRSPDHAESMDDPGSALPRTVAEIPLGTRRSLARSLDRDLLERLLLDPDPIVIGNLLENGRITEDQVVRIAARRPISDSTLLQIHRSRRFGGRPRVRVAIARNPYCPTDLAIELLASLDATNVREVARDGTLHEEVRRHAEAEIARREAPDQD